MHVWPCLTYFVYLLRNISLAEAVPAGLINLGLCATYMSVCVFSLFFCVTGRIGLVELKRFRPRRGPEDGQVGFERHHRQRRVVLELRPAVVRCTGRERGGRTATGEALVRGEVRERDFFLSCSCFGVRFCPRGFLLCE